MGDDPIATWKSKIKWFSGKQSLQGYESNRRACRRSSSGKISPGITTLRLLEKIQSLMRDLQCEPEHFNDRIIFMSMYNDIAWQEKGNTERCEYNSQTVTEYGKFPRGHWFFLEPGSEKKWYGTYTDKPDGSWDRIAENMIVNFSDSGQPIFRASSAFERGELRSKEHGKNSFHFSGSDENIELLLRTVISANQLSAYGAVADLCNELSEDLGASEKPWSTWSSGNDVDSYWPFYCRNSYGCTATGRHGAKRKRAKFRTIVRKQEIIQITLPPEI